MEVALLMCITLPLPRWILPVLTMHISELSLLISVVKTRVTRVEDVHSFGCFYKGHSAVEDHHGHNEL
jgi:flagellar biosynthesis component FlhA